MGNNDYGQYNVLLYHYYIYSSYPTNQINNRNLNNNNSKKLLSEIKWEKIPNKNSPKLIIWDIIRFLILKKNLDY